MRHLLSIILVILVLGSCTRYKPGYMDYFLGNAWLLGDRIILRNDSILSPSNYDTARKQFTGNTAFLLQVSDSVLIYKRYELNVQNRSVSGKLITGDSLYTDTALYDFRLINQVPRLVIYLPGAPLILTGADASLPIAETFRVQPPRFVISGYSIGDQIDRNLLKTRGIYNYRDYSIEDCELAQNSDIQIKIIGYNTIFAIERHNIPDSKVKEIIGIVSAKLGVEPQYSPMKKWSRGADYEYEFYRWNKNYVRVTLSRSRYAGSANYYKYLLDKDSWNLSYDDDIQKALLIERFKNPAQSNAIIE